MAFQSIPHYQELYHFAPGGQSLVIDPASQRIYLKKTLTHFDIGVYRWLSAHSCPHVPRIIDFYEDPDNKTLTVIESYVQGETLDQYLDRLNAGAAAPSDFGASDCHEVFRKITDSLLNAVEFLHSADPPIIHRDIKPENIIISENGSVFLADYDAARLFERGKNRDTVLIGTEGSAAPEQYGFAQSDERTDIYAIGVLLKRLFPDDPAVLAVASRCTKMDADKRYRDIPDLRSALKGAFGDHTFLSLFPPPGFRTGKIYHMLPAAVYYIFLIALAASFTPADVDGGPIARLWVVRSCVILAGLTAIDIFTDWTHAFRTLPFMRDRRPVVRFLIRLFYSAAAFFIMVLLSSFLCGVIN